MRLANPYYLLFFLTWLPIIWLYVRRETKSRPAITFSDVSMFKDLPISFKVRSRHIVFILRLLASGLLIIALARPQKGRSEQEVTTRGVDIMLTLDVSTSMKALDFKPKNRLFVAKEKIKDFISKREHDRIGLVVFAARAYTKSPLTLDYNVISSFIDDIRFDEIEDGTAIGTALATAAARLKESDAKSRIIILLTDGANNRGEITPIIAAQAASKLGIKIYTIGIGKSGEVPFPVQVKNPWTGKVETRIDRRKSDIDEQTLVNIANETGGQFFRAHNTKELESIYATIDELEKTEIKTISYTTWAEKFYPWLFVGFLLLILEILLSNTFYRKVP